MAVTAGLMVASARRALVEHLTGDRPEEACRVVAAAVDRGLGPVEAYVDLLGSAVEEALGVDPLHEGVSLVVAGQVANYLHDRLERPPQGTKGLVLVGTPDGDPHDVEARVIAEVLAMDGYEVHLLAADTAVERWCEFVRLHESLVAVVVAVATPAGARLAAASTTQVRSAVNTSAPHVLLAMAVGRQEDLGGPVRRRSSRAPRGT
jgi:methanogenic corrinoid protein MtbC1